MASSGDSKSILRGERWVQPKTTIALPQVNNANNRVDNANNRVNNANNRVNNANNRVDANNRDFNVNGSEMTRPLERPSSAASNSQSEEDVQPDSAIDFGEASDQEQPAVRTDAQRRVGRRGTLRDKVQVYKMLEELIDDESGEDEPETHDGV